jgi:hypothetical protein
MGNQIINRVCGNAVAGLSLFAMLLAVGATVLAMLGRIHPSTDGDEGTVAHLFQLAIVLLLPTTMAFLVTADWRRPRQVVRRLALPAAALMVAFSTLYYMEHLR